MWREFDGFSTRAMWREFDCFSRCHSACFGRYRLDSSETIKANISNRFFPCGTWREYAHLSPMLRGGSMIVFPRTM
ncbi:hypothetical protein HanIR_Chr10g0474121 [Helianthus annuus]|nr:hypothetical protein HanIR_Chr10g0474121 [Helianthus annuus]